ncbi:MAG: MBL fold metallo-hydrolase [Thermoleophilia bacterium]|jgi:glyoxylase-like metal-dependent hydrolase (beta-lactamase superfamily II)
MKTTEVARGVYQVGLRGVNVFLIDSGDGLVLIDAGLRHSPPRITEAIYSLGRLPQDVVAIVITHAHRDHVGGLAEMKRRTGAEVWMHPSDAALVRDGRYGRPFQRRRGRASDALVRAMNLLPTPKGEAVAVAHEVSDGEVLPFDGLRAVHTPGHTAGHLALLLPREGGVLFVGDAAANVFRTGLSPLNEDVAEGRRSLEKLAAIQFEVACFAHGRALRRNASEAFGEFVRRLESTDAKIPAAGDS